MDDWRERTPLPCGFGRRARTVGGTIQFGKRVSGTTPKTATGTVALPMPNAAGAMGCAGSSHRSEEHTSELQSLRHLVFRLLLEKKTKSSHRANPTPHTARSTHLVSLRRRT